jgi:hypothetical protein
VCTSACSGVHSHPEGANLTFTYDEWRAFVDSVKSTDDYDLPR